MKIYLSYNPNDAAHAAKLRPLLKEEGFEVWDANVHVLPGDNWPKLFDKALRESKSMILVVSPMMLKNPFFQREIDYAIGHMQFAHRLFVCFTKPKEELKNVPWILENKLIHRLNLFPGRVKPVVRKITAILHEQSVVAVSA